MPKPIQRTLAVLELLQTHARINGADLSRLLGIDARAVRRHVRQLELLGIPLATTRGRDGGYALAQGYKLPPMMFTADEALALAMGLHAVRSLGLDALTPSVASAQAKLARVLPADVRHQMRDLADVLSLDMPRPHAVAAPGTLIALTHAAQAQQRVSFSYRAGMADQTAQTDQTAQAAYPADQAHPALLDAVAAPMTEREVNVYGVAFRGAWYAVGYCHLRRALRSFRLDRIEAVQALPKTFARPEGFDVMDYLARSIASLPRAHAIEVRLHADMARAQRAVASHLGTLHDDEGHAKAVILLAQADDLNWFARELSRLPFAVTVLQPQALGVALRAHAQALLAQLDQGQAVAIAQR